MPAPAGNTNAVRNGLRTRHTLTVGTLGRAFRHVTAATNDLRRHLEAAIAERNDGTVTVYQAGLIRSACIHERHRLLCTRWLRVEHASMTLDQRLNYSREITRASDAFDRCLRALGLDATCNGDPWQSILEHGHVRDGAPGQLPAPQTSKNENASGSRTEPESGIADDEVAQ